MLHAALERHSATPCPAVRGVEAALMQDSGKLRITFRVEGQIGRLRIPPPRSPRVADKLWQHTCCEIFLADAAGAGYREFNFSPSGEWAAYQFTRYREGAPLAVPDPRIVVRQDARSLVLQAAVPSQRDARIGLSAVIEETGGALSYWALRHAPGKPDFHHPDAFALELH